MNHRTFPPNPRKKPTHHQHQSWLQHIPTWGETLSFHLHTMIAVSVGEADNSSFPAGSQARCVTGQWPGCCSTCTELVDGLQFNTQTVLMHFILPVSFFRKFVMQSNKQQTTHSKFCVYWLRNCLSAKNWSPHWAKNQSSHFVTDNDVKNA